MENSETLTARRCKPCEGGIPPLNRQEIGKYMEALGNDWNVIDNKKLYKEYSFVNYKHTMEFVNKAANLAEEERHHPVLHVHFGKAVVEIWTHAIGGLSENDFILASKMDLLV